MLMDKGWGGGGAKRPPPTQKTQTTNNDETWHSYTLPKEDTKTISIT